jgi:DNA-binding LytR/AlgR family response regulator
MPAISGLDFLKILHRPPKVIITTAYREYALDGYDLDITDYLLKPITFDRFFKAIERYLRNNNLTGLSAVPLGNERAALYIKSAHRNIKVNTSDILYVESLKDYVKIYTAETSITAKFKISDMEVELASKGFLRVHRSFIINLSHLTAFTSRDVEIGKIELPIGESYKELVFQTLKKS